MLFLSQDLFLQFQDSELSLSGHSSIIKADVIDNKG